MALYDNIVIADAQETPVNHTFKHTGKDESGVHWFTDSSQANAIGYWKISVSTTQPKPARAGDQAGGRSFKVKIGLHEPVLAASGTASSGYAVAPKVAYVPRSFTEFLIPEETTKLDRENLAKMTPLLLQNTDMKSLVVDLIQIR